MRGERKWADINLVLKINLINSVYLTIIDSYFVKVIKHTLIILTEIHACCLVAVSYTLEQCERISTVG